MKNKFKNNRYYVAYAHHKWANEDDIKVGDKSFSSFSKAYEYAGDLLCDDDSVALYYRVDGMWARVLSMGDKYKPSKKKIQEWKSRAREARIWEAEEYKHTQHAQSLNALNAFEKQLATESAPVCHAYWKQTKDCPQYYYCTNCNCIDYSMLLTKYCPHCGAEMNLKEIEEQRNKLQNAIDEIK